MSPYRTAAIDETAIVDAEEVAAFAASARRARVAGSVAAMVAIVASLTVSLAASLNVTGRGASRMARSPAPTSSSATLRACTVRGCYTYVSCLDTSLPKDAPCNY